MGNIKKRGRKNEGKAQVCYKLAPDVVRFLRDHERPASRLIEEAVRNFYGLNKNISWHGDVREDN